MRMSICISAVLVGVMLMLSGVPVQAHHSTPVYYDMSKTIEISGVMTKLRVVNPHASMTIEVTNPDGTKEEWLGVGGFATQMIRVGWTNETLPVGTKMKVEGTPARQKGAKGLLIK